MSQWSDRVTQHALKTELAGLGPAIDRVAGKWGIDAPTIASIERIRTVLTFVGKRFAAADPELVDPRPLSALAKALATARAELEAYAADSNVAHIDTANAQADDALALAVAIPNIETPEDLTWILESVAAFRATAEKHLNETLAKHGEVYGVIEKTQAAVTEAQAQLTALKEKIAAGQTEQQTQFSGAQDNRATEFGAAQTDRQTKYAAALTEMQTAFATAQNDRQQQFTAATTDYHAKFTASQDERSKSFAAAEQQRQTGYSDTQTQYTTTINEYTKELDRLKDAANKTAAEAIQILRTTYEASAKQILETMNTHRVQVEKLVGVIGNLGVTSGYQITANRAQKAAYLWQFLTVAALGGLITVAYVIAFAPPAAESAFLQGLSTRIFLSITVGVFAAYAAKQASNNLEIERKHRKLALEMEALGPFLAPLPEDMRNKFRAELGDRSFGIADGEHGKSKEGDPVTATHLLPLLKDALTELAKRK